MGKIGILGLGFAASCWAAAFFHLGLPGRALTPSLAVAVGHMGVALVLFLECDCGKHRKQHGPRQ